MTSIDRLPETLHDKVIKMLNNPRFYQTEIVEAINAEAGKKVISFSSLNRYAQNMKKLSGNKRGMKPPSIEQSFRRTATALEQIAFFWKSSIKTKLRILNRGSKPGTWLRFLPIIKKLKLLHNMQFN